MLRYCRKNQQAQDNRQEIDRQENERTKDHEGPQDENSRKVGMEERAPHG